jgi:hypothetical protein
MTLSYPSSGRSTEHSLQSSATEESSHGSTATQENPHSALLRTHSQVFCSERSSSSSAGFAAVRARAKAEAAKARLSYAKDEAPTN